MRAALLLMLALPAAAQEAWERRVVELAPALRACLADRPGAMVVDAWPLIGNLAAARVLLPGGAREDCVAEPGTGRVDSRRTVEPGDLRPGEGVRAFMPERRCVDARRVTTEEGRELGWLAYPGCG